MKHYIYNSIAILISMLVLSCSNVPEFDINDEEVLKIVEAHTDSAEAHEYFPDKDVRNYLHTELNQFYADRDYRLAWLEFDEPKKATDELLASLDNAEAQGLDSEHYRLPEIENLLEQVYEIESRKDRRKTWRKKVVKSKKFKERFKARDTLLFNQIVELDLLMSASYLTYASHLLSGKIRPDEGEYWYSKPRKKDLSKYLEEAVASGEVTKSLMDLNPPHPQYTKLTEKLKKYQEIVNAEDFEDIRIAKTLESGDNDEQVVRLKKRLASTGLLDKRNSFNEEYNEETAKAVQTFQMLHGLPITGKVDEKTLSRLNIPIADIIEKIKFNMERIRWIHGPFGDHYVLVNIPDFKMRVIKNDKTELQMRTVVGEFVNKTPIFSDSMEYIVFSPTWNVPKSIAVGEMLPRIKKDPSYLPTRNFKLYDSWSENAQAISPDSVDWTKVDGENFKFRIVEDPGPSNSLGLVKFIFPNSLDIYLHDTPADHLFGENQRDFSHGCIRLERPADFAHYLLEDKGWDMEKVDEYMHKDEPQFINLEEKLPVHIVYWTAWVDDNGFLNLRDDVYNFDKEQTKQLDQKNKELTKEADTLIS